MNISWITIRQYGRYWSAWSTFYFSKPGPVFLVSRHRSHDVALRKLRSKIDQQLHRWCKKMPGGYWVPKAA